MKAKEEKGEGSRRGAEEEEEGNEDRRERGGGMEGKWRSWGEGTAFVNISFCKFCGSLWQGYSREHAIAPLFFSA